MPRPSRRQLRRERRLSEAVEIAYELAMNEHARQLEVQAWLLEWSAAGRPSARDAVLAFAFRLEARLLRSRVDYLTPSF